MLAQLIVARALGAAGYGIFGYATACATTMITLGKYGTDTLVYRLGGQFHAASDWSSFRALMNRAKALAWRASLVGCGTLVAYAWLLFNRKGDAVLGLAIAVGALGVPIVALSTLRQAALISIGRTIQGLAPDHLVRTSVLILGAILLWLEDKATPLAMVSANILSYAAAYTFGQYWLARTPVSQAVVTLTRSEMLRWDSSARGLFLFGCAYQLVSQFDILLVGFLLDARSTGLYAAARQVASVGMLALFAFQTVASPRMAAAYSEGNRAALSRVVDAVAVGGAAFTLLYGLMLFFYGRELLGLLGREFPSAYVCLMWIVAAQVVNVIVGPTGTVSSMLGFHGQATLAYIGAAVVGSILLALMVPVYGINGAAGSVVAATALWGVTLNVVLYRKTGATVWLGRRRGER